MAGMENFVLRTLAAFASSVLVFYLDLDLSFYSCVASGENLSSALHSGLRAAAGFLFEVYFVRFQAAIICFVLVFILMGRNFPISPPQTADNSN
jgi:hypothetical protein